jgi:hypothetical protein
LTLLLTENLFFFERCFCSLVFDGLRFQEIYDFENRLFGPPLCFYVFTLIACLVWSFRSMFSFQFNRNLCRNFCHLQEYYQPYYLPFVITYALKKVTSTFDIHGPVMDYSCSEVCVCLIRCKLCWRVTRYFLFGQRRFRQFLQYSNDVKTFNYFPIMNNFYPKHKHYYDYVSHNPTFFPSYGGYSIYFTLSLNSY